MSTIHNVVNNLFIFLTTPVKYVVPRLDTLHLIPSGCLTRQADPGGIFHGVNKDVESSVNQPEADKYFFAPDLFLTLIRLNQSDKGLIYLRSFRLMKVMHHLSLSAYLKVQGIRHTV